MKKLTALLTLSLAGSLYAGTILAQHSYIYKDARIMGMGGTNVAIGGYSTSLFSNPAGIAKIKKSHGLEVELLGLTASGSAGYLDVANDFQALSETDYDSDAAQYSAYADFLGTYNGQNLNVETSMYSSVSYNGDWIAWSVGLLLDNTSINYIPHTAGGFGTAGGVLGVSVNEYSGLVLGMAKSFPDIGPGQLDIGIGAKYMLNIAGVADLTIGQVIEASSADNPADAFTIHSGSAIAFDLGMNYKMFEESGYPTTFSMSLMNIGGLNFSGSLPFGLQDSLDDQNITNSNVSPGDNPMTLNFGVAVSPDIPWFEHLILSADYVDALNANTYILADINGFTEYSESDFMKRFRLGASFGMIDNSLFMLTLNTGLYQAAYTAGIDMQLSILKLAATTYAEEIGLTGDGTSISDRRYMVNLGIGW